MLSQSLLDTLPDEILGYIMTATLHSYPDLPSQHQFPTTMLLTSRRLQRIAIITPSVWTTLLIRLPTNFAAVTSRLKRAGVLPLRIEVGWTDKVREVENADRLANTLHQEAHRLIEFRLRCCFNNTAQAQEFLDFLLPPDVSFPLIRHLALEVSGEFGDVILSRPNAFPKLRYLTGRQIDPQWTTWQNTPLRELYLFNCEAKTLQDMAHLLGAFPSLRLVHFQEFQLAETGFAIGETVILMPELEVLRLLETTVLDCNIMLGVLEMPMLRSLVLGGGADGWTGQVWVPLHKPFPTLREVSILEWFNCMDNDRPFFQNLAFLGPNVTRFRFDCYYFSITRGLGLGCTFPKLRHLATSVPWRSESLLGESFDLTSLDTLSIYVECLGLERDNNYVSTRHQASIEEARKKCNVNFYGESRRRVFGSWLELLGETCVNNNGTNAPKDEFLDMWFD